ncbi:endolytic transglycosylase MltG [Candidatus Parcubacteria bacterium]|nr:endolytic transglycosylase MltG [Candidatus Parcubacteria bacterium]
MYKRDWRVYAGMVLVLIILSFGYSFSAPKNFPVHGIVTLRQGAGLSELSLTLKRNHVIRSATWFRVTVIILGGERGIQAGDYYLSKRESSARLAWRMVHADRDLSLVRITIPEGFTVKDISKLFDERFPLFSHKDFEASAPEGYLFPDTYFVYVNATASSTIGFFQDNFHNKVDPLADEVKASGHSIYNIIVLASILEAETKTPEDMAVVSGIMWKRLKLDMPLQVDSAPETYKTKGLPRAPINNPGLVAIKAAIHPKDSPYLYFISDKQNQIHYAKTLDEQTANINKYLK